MAVPLQEYSGGVLNDQSIAAHVPSSACRPAGLAIGAGARARASAVVRVPSGVHLGGVGERPWAAFDALLGGVVRVAGMVAPMNHMKQNALAEWARFGRNFTGYESIDLLGRAGRVIHCESNVGMGEAAHLVLNDADEVPSAPAEVVLEEGNHLQEARVKHADDDVWSVSSGLSWQEGGLNFWPVWVARQGDEEGRRSFTSRQF
eukprot:9503993-Pyramimonas_sp.AAC.2